MASLITCPVVAGVFSSQRANILKVLWHQIMVFHVLVLCKQVMPFDLLLGPFAVKFDYKYITHNGIKFVNGLCIMETILSRPQSIKYGYVHWRMAALGKKNRSCLCSVQNSINIVKQFQWNNHEEHNEIGLLRTDDIITRTQSKTNPWPYLIRVVSP